MVLSIVYKAIVIQVTNEYDNVVMTVIVVCV